MAAIWSTLINQPRDLKVTSHFVILVKIDAVHITSEKKRELLRWVIKLKPAICVFHCSNDQSFLSQWLFLTLLTCDSCVCQHLCLLSERRLWFVQEFHEKLFIKCPWILTVPPWTSNIWDFKTENHIISGWLYQRTIFLVFFRHLNSMIEFIVMQTIHKWDKWRAKRHESKHFPKAKERVMSLKLSSN